MFRTYSLLFGALLFIGCSAAEIPNPAHKKSAPVAKQAQLQQTDLECKLSGGQAEPTEIHFTRVLAGTAIRKPVQIATDAYDQTFVVGKDGKIYKTNGGLTARGTAALWLDMSDQVESGPNEAGLLAIAFDPRYAVNGRLYIHYNRRQNGQLQSVIARLTVADPEDGQPDLSTEEELLVLDQPYANHNGGQIAFGVDGFLYIAFGDGGSAGDPRGHGQNLGTLFAAILRIDVNQRSGSTPYAIPADNPFVGTPGARPEIFAYGLRNVWRFSFDSITHTLWAGDVGQNAWEEINILEKGGNYGWNTMEGEECFEPANNCEREGLKLPVITLPRSQARSITGGYVYRGEENPSLYGTYIYGDYVTKKVFGLVPDGQGGYRNQDLGVAPGGMASFGVDSAGELYLLDYDHDHIYKIAEGESPLTGGAGWPLRLSQTGCFQDTAAREFKDDVLPYTVNVSLWANGSNKERGLLLPPDEQLGFKAEGVWTAPTGTVAIKTFLQDERPIETRLLVKTADGVSGVSYLWNEEGDDAFLAVNGADLDLGESRWTVPGSMDCVECHNQADDGFLGIKAGQLHTNRQIEDWVAAGIFHNAGAVDIGAIEPYSITSGDLDSNARTYLDVNCSSCHRPGGTDLSNMDLRKETPFSATETCGTVPDQGDMDIPGARIIAPGDAAASVLYTRMRTDDEIWQMPRIGRDVVDTAGMGMLEDWIESLNGCP